jgi:hypothetical protein
VNWQPRVPPVKGAFHQAEMVLSVGEAVGEVHGPALVGFVLDVEVQVVRLGRAAREGAEDVQLFDQAQRPVVLVLVQPV